ncbi:MAG: hypothetical protein H6Q68_2403 [Firmicutes bacterium]|nr:hypothetical protein [Bacillota bacterium]
MVIFLPKHKLTNEEISDGVNLLISILIRYPEIGTVSFDPQYNQLNLKFMLSAIPSQDEFSNIKNLLIDSIAVYNMLEGLSLKTSEIQLHTHDKVAMLSIVRDVHTISKNEITLIIVLLREKLKDYLIFDYNVSLSEEDLLLQEEVIENMLENIKQNLLLHRLIGIRENGRILVFNK